MAHVAVAQPRQEAEVIYFPRTQIAEAEKLLLEVRALERRRLGLAMMSIYHQELVWLIKNFPKDFYYRHVLAELKSYSLAFAISIEKYQSIQP